MKRKIAAFLSIALVGVLVAAVPFAAVRADETAGTEDATETVKVVVENSTNTDYEAISMEAEVLLNEESTMESVLTEALVDRLDSSITVETAEDGAVMVTEVAGLANAEDNDAAYWVALVNGFPVDDITPFTYEAGSLSNGAVIALKYTMDFGNDLGVEVFSDAILAIENKGKLVNPDDTTQPASGYGLIIDDAGNPQSPSFVLSDWKFANALAQAGGPGVSVERDYDKKTALIKNGYHYFDGEDYDINMVFSEIEGHESKFPNSFTSGNLGINERDPGTGRGAVRYLTVGLSGGERAFDIEIWLSKGEEKVTNVPLVVGPCYNANSYEDIRVFSNEDKIITSIPVDVDVSASKITYRSEYQGWKPPATDNSKGINYDIPHEFMLGLGNVGGVVKVGYHTTNTGTGGALELRFGYQAYVVAFNYMSADDATTDIDSQEVPITGDLHASYPTSKISTTLPTDKALSHWTANQDVTIGGTTYEKGDHISDSKVQSYVPTINESDVTKLWVAEKDINLTSPVTLEDGTEIRKVLKGMKFTESDKNSILGKIADADKTAIKLYQNITFTAHLISDPVKLTFEDPNGIFVASDLPDVQNIEKNKANAATDPKTATDFIPGKSVMEKNDKYYRFDGWYKDADLDGKADNEFDFSEAFPNDVTAYGKWTEVIKVVFDIKGGTSGQPDSQYIEPDTTASDPTKGASPVTPVKSGYIFKGWSETDGGTEPFDFTEKIQTNKTLYAIWEPAPDTITVTYDMNGVTVPGTKPGSETINKGTTPTNPGSVSADGWVFKGWSTDKNSKNPMTPAEVAATALNTNTKYYAIWERVNTDPYYPPSNSQPGTTTPTTPNPPKADTPADPVTPEKPADPTNPVDTTVPSDPTDTPASPEGTPIQNPVNVQFITDHGVVPQNQVHETGDLAQNPGAPMDPNTLQPGDIVDGWRFEGWFLDPEFTIAYDFNTPLTDDIVLYAKWTNISAPATSPKTADGSMIWLYTLFAALLGSLACGGILGLTFLRRK